MGKKCFVPRCNSGNRKHPKEGLREGSKDFSILESTLQWLNNWEKDVELGKVNPHNFLPKSNAEGMRVRILSTIQLSKYLLEQCGFKYLLTAKFNQDVLEKFFGVIRQANGQNDHPCLPTFLQLYNMLSIYSLVKLPKFGNCQVQISEEPRLLSLSDLTSAFQESAPLESRLEGLKQKLDGLVEEEAECENVFSDISSSDNVTDSIIYHVRFLCRKILKNTTCQQCRNGLAATSNAASKPEAALVACKTRGGLVHPNTCLFRFLKEVEAMFCKHAGEKHAYDMTIDYVVENFMLSFPCHEHKVDIMSKVLHYYI